MKRKTIVLGVCASIAAYKACEIVTSIKKSNIETVVCLSKDADKFITPLTLQTLSCNKAYQNMFDAHSDWDPKHISLAKRADLLLVAPATADIISKVAAGICDDLLSCTIASTKAPVVFAPAMNDQMYNNKIIQGNITKLKSLGYKFVGPIKGSLACGETGIGHIASVADIVKKAKSLLK